MANFSVAPTLLSGNDISSLAQIFTLGLQYYRDHRDYTNPLEKDYIGKLNVIVALSLATAISDPNLLSVYRPDLCTFLAHVDFKKETSDINALTLAVATLVSRAAWFFLMLSYPAYHQLFAKSLKETMTHLAVQGSDQASEAERLLRILV
jgi:hypothetical protein